MYRKNEETTFDWSFMELNYPLEKCSCVYRKLSVVRPEACCYSCHKMLSLQFRVSSFVISSLSWFSIGEVTHWVDRPKNRELVVYRGFDTQNSLKSNLLAIDFFLGWWDFIFNFLRWQMTFIFPQKMWHEFSSFSHRRLRTLTTERQKKWEKTEIRRNRFEYLVTAPPTLANTENSSILVFEIFFVGTNQHTCDHGELLNIQKKNRNLRHSYCHAYKKEN